MFPSVSECVHLMYVLRRDHSDSVGKVSLVALSSSAKVYARRYYSGIYEV